MRAVFISLVLVICGPAVLTAEEVIKFTPLKSGERFAYSIYGGITLYAVKDNDIGTAARLVSWPNNVSWARVQFTDDFRTCFFLEEEEGYQYNLCMADGNTGEMRRLFTDISPYYRVLGDGRFVAIVEGDDGDGFNSYSAHVILFDTEADAVTAEFEFRLNGPVQLWSYIYRFGDVFRIYGVSEGFDIMAFAELNPATRGLKTVWDITDGDLSGLPDGFSKPPNVELDKGWKDNALYYSNPNVRLER